MGGTTLPRVSSSHPRLINSPLIDKQWAAAAMRGGRLLEAAAWWSCLARLPHLQFSLCFRTLLTRWCKQELWQYTSLHAGQIAALSSSQLKDSCLITTDSSANCLVRRPLKPQVYSRHSCDVRSLCSNQSSLSCVTLNLDSVANTAHVQDEG